MTDLSGALLANSDLSRLNLSDVILASSDLSNADLRKARLTQADLRWANLADADFRGADLTDADFREASLAGADLRDDDEPMRVAGILLGGADLSNATLAAQLPLEADLESARDAAGAVNNIFLVLATAIAYCALTMVTTTDEKLVPDASLALVPLIQTSVPIRNFFQFAPIAVILVSVYLQFNLVQFFRTAARLPGRFPDGAALSERVSSWALSALLLRWHGRPFSSGPPGPGWPRWSIFRVLVCCTARNSSAVA